MEKKIGKSELSPLCSDAKNRKLALLGLAKSDWSKRIRDFQYMDYDDYAAHH